MNMLPKETTHPYCDMGKNGSFDGELFIREFTELQEEVIHNRPNPKWIAELLYMVSSGEISQSVAKQLQDTYMERRINVYKQIYDLTQSTISK